MPLVTKYDEVLVPSSLLYGNYSGGVIHVLGEEHEHELLKQGYSLDLSSQYGSNGAGYAGGTILRISDNNVSFFANTFYSNAQNYNDANNNEVKKFRYTFFTVSYSFRISA